MLEVNTLTIISHLCIHIYIYIDAEIFSLSGAERRKKIESVCEFMSTISAVVVVNGINSESCCSLQICTS